MSEVHVPGLYKRSQTIPAAVYTSRYNGLRLSETESGRWLFLDYEIVEEGEYQGREFSEAFNLTMDGDGNPVNSFHVDMLPGVLEQLGIILREDDTFDDEDVEKQLYMVMLTEGVSKETGKKYNNVKKRTRIE